MKIKELMAQLSKYDENEEITFCCNGCGDPYACDGFCAEYINEDWKVNEFYYVIGNEE